LDQRLFGIKKLLESEIRRFSVRILLNGDRAWETGFRVIE